MKKLFTAFSIFALALSAAKPAMASQVNIEFPSCLAPSGNVTADYATGTHGIVGNSSKDGHDTVYSLDNGNTLQCLCATDGTGTQTNWMSVGEMAEDQIKVYQNQGWIFVPDASPWGLGDGSYLAKNISYSCGGGSSTTQNSGGDGKSDGKSDGRSDGRSDGASTVQAATGNNALASTGDTGFVLGVLVAGLALIATGIVMRVRNN